MKKSFIKLISLLALSIIFMDANAQLNTLDASFYNNQYLSNPAFAGNDMKIGIHYRNQWNAIPGSPVNYAITGEYKLRDERSGIALYAANDRSGLLSHTTFKATFAYHLPLTNMSSKLHFGLSVGYVKDRVGQSINGDDADQVLSAYNNQPSYVDGDFGMAYTDNQLTIQATLPNLRALWKGDAVNNNDLDSYFAAIAYKIFSDDGHGYNLEPKIAYRDVRGNKGIIDAGLQVTLGMNINKANAMLIYHSSKSISAGIGMIFKSRLEVIAGYNTQTSSISKYTNGAFELGLGVKL